MGCLPFSHNDRVQVVSATDPEIHSIHKRIGHVGRVVRFLKNAGIGDNYPTDPVIEVKFAKRKEIFWKEELRLYKLEPISDSTVSLKEELEKLKHIVQLSWIDWEMYHKQHPATEHGDKMLRIANIKRELRRRSRR